MSVKFLGQFLIEHDHLSDDQVREALDPMESENRTLGELAVAAGFASADEVRRVNGVQRRRDVRFGELALQMGVLNSIELDELLEQQQRERVHLEVALTRLHHVSPTKMGSLLEAFAEDQAPYASVELSLPGELAGNPVAMRLVDLLPRFCMRVGRIEVKVETGRVLEEPPDFPLVATLGIIGSHGVELALATEPAFAERLASGISGLDLSTTDGGLAGDLAADAIGEFLNVLAGNVVSVLDQEGAEYRVEAPRFGALPTTGYEFGVVSTTAGAAIVISPLKLTNE
jgi:CheY-specific phosphatase CheX